MEEYTVDVEVEYEEWEDDPPQAPGPVVTSGNDDNDGGSWGVTGSGTDHTATAGTGNMSWTDAFHSAASENIQSHQAAGESWSWSSWSWE